MKGDTKCRNKLVWGS